MVNTNAYTWKEYSSSTATEVLYSKNLKWNFNYVSAMINKGINGTNIATGGLDSSALFASAVVTNGALNFNTGGGCRVVRIGKAWTTTGGRVYVQGTSLITAANVTNTDITVYYTGDALCTAGDVPYTGTPFVKANLYTTNTLAGCVNYRVATNVFTVNVDLGGTLTFATAHTLYWMACGNVA